MVLTIVYDCCLLLTALFAQSYFILCSQLVFGTIFEITNRYLRKFLKNSMISQGLEIFMKQAMVYMSCSSCDDLAIALILLLSATMLVAIVSLIPQPNYNKDANLMFGNLDLVAEVFTWLYDNYWFKYILKFRDDYIGHLSAAPKWLVSLFIFACLFVFKNIVHRFLVSAVVDGYKKYQAFNDCVFNREIIDSLIAKWKM